MDAWATAMAVSFATLAALPAFADETSFFHVPGVKDFRLQQIEKANRENAWPFTVPRGWLACAYVTGERTVYFAELADDIEEDDPRVTIVSTDPMLLMTGAVLGDGLLPKTNTVDEMANTMRLLGPYEALGKRLCDQPPGVILEGGEL